jgi:hypothetical protein
MGSQRTCPILEREEAASNQPSTSPQKKNNKMKNNIITHIRAGYPGLQLVSAKV